MGISSAGPRASIRPRAGGSKPSGPIDGAPASELRGCFRPSYAAASAAVRSRGSRWEMTFETPSEPIETP
jgi:hypothetical protein